jgi:nucleotide-binding universal stress UspA family protein
MHNLLVAIDFSDQTDAILQLAGQLGLAFDAHVWLLHIVTPDPEFVGYEPGPKSVRDQVAKELRAEHQQTQLLAKQLGLRGVEATALTVQGPAVEKILAQRHKIDPDLVIMGSHGHGAVYRTLLGSVSEGVLRRAGCPVLIIPSQHSADVGAVTDSESASGSASADGSEHG